MNKVFSEKLKVLSSYLKANNIGFESEAASSISGIIKFAKKSKAMLKNREKFLELFPSVENDPENLRNHKRKVISVADQYFKLFKDDLNYDNLLEMSLSDVIVFVSQKNRDYRDKGIQSLKEKHPSLKTEIDKLITSEVNREHYDWAIKILNHEEQDSVEEIIEYIGFYQRNSEAVERPLESFDSLSDLRSYMDDVLVSNKEYYYRQAEKVALSGNNTDIIYNSKKFLVVLPGSTLGSQYWAKGTNWCTASLKSNMYQGYSSSGIYLYYVLTKAITDEEYIGNKVQGGLMRKFSVGFAKKDGKAFLLEKGHAVVNADNRSISREQILEYLGDEGSTIMTAMEKDLEGRENTKIVEMLRELTVEEMEQQIALIGSPETAADTLEQLSTSEHTSSEVKVAAVKKLVRIKPEESFSVINKITLRPGEDQHPRSYKNLGLGVDELDEIKELYGEALKKFEWKISAGIPKPLPSFFGGSDATPRQQERDEKIRTLKRQYRAIILGNFHSIYPEIIGKIMSHATEDPKLMSMTTHIIARKRLYRLGGKYSEIVNEDTILNFPDTYFDTDLDKTKEFGHLADDASSILINTVVGYDAEKRGPGMSEGVFRAAALKAFKANGVSEENRIKLFAKHSNTGGYIYDSIYALRDLEKNKETRDSADRIFEQVVEKWLKGSYGYYIIYKYMSKDFLERNKDAIVSASQNVLKERGLRDLSSLVRNKYHKKAPYLSEIIIENYAQKILKEMEEKQTGYSYAFENLTDNIGLFYSRNLDKVSESGARYGKEIAKNMIRISRENISKKDVDSGPRYTGYSPPMEYGEAAKFLLFKFFNINLHKRYPHYAKMAAELIREHFPEELENSRMWNWNIFSGGKGRALTIATDAIEDYYYGNSSYSNLGLYEKDGRDAVEALKEKIIENNEKIFIGGWKSSDVVQDNLRSFIEGFMSWSVINLTFDRSENIEAVFGLSYDSFGNEMIDKGYKFREGLEYETYYELLTPSLSGEYGLVTMEELGIEIDDTIAPDIYPEFDEDIEEAEEESGALRELEELEREEEELDREDEETYKAWEEEEKEEELARERALKEIQWEEPQRPSEQPHIPGRPKVPPYEMRTWEEEEELMGEPIEVPVGQGIEEVADPWKTIRANRIRKRRRKASLLNRISRAEKLS